MPRRLFHLLNAAMPAGDHVPDAELLRRFAATKDAAAFELLVRRHAETVWAACRRIVRHEADAEDAFQATFLVLLRKASSVRGTCVGGWLHRVAVNAALKLKANGRRQPAGLANGQRELAGVLPTDQPADAGRSPDPELAALVHQELARLPDRYRLPVVLCDLEGHTHAEAAKMLNWPVGSVSGRLSRAHVLLRDRLTRRGVTAPAIGLGLVLSAGSISADAVRSVVSVAAGLDPVSPVVSTLTQGVLSAMRTANLKLTATIAVGVMVLAGVGTALAWSRGGPAIPSPHPETAAPLLVAADPPIEGDWLPKKATDPVPTAFPELKLPDTVNRKRDEYINSLAQHCPRVCGKDSVSIEATDDTYRRLLKARLHQARIEIRGLQSRFLIGAYTSQETTMFHHCLEDVRAVAMELWRNEPKQLIPWLEEFVILAKEWENLTAGRVTAGTDPPYALNAARRHRLEAEAALWKAKNLGRAK